MFLFLRPIRPGRCATHAKRGRVFCMIFMMFYTFFAFTVPLAAKPFAVAFLVSIFQHSISLLCFHYNTEKGNCRVGKICLLYTSNISFGDAKLFIGGFIMDLATKNELMKTACKVRMGVIEAVFNASRVIRAVHSRLPICSPTFILRR